MNYPKHDISKIALRDFLTTGQLGPLKMGQTPEEIVKILGEAPDWSIRGHGKDRDKAFVWKYGILQIAFSHIDHKSVTYLGLYPEDKIDLPEMLQIEGYFPTDETTFEEFVNYLKSENLEYINDPRFAGSADLHLLVAAQVGVSFYEHGTLAKMIASSTKEA